MPRRRNDIVLQNSDVRDLIEIVGRLSGKDTITDRTIAVEILSQLTATSALTISKLLRGAPVLRKTVCNIHDSLLSLSRNVEPRVDLAFLQNIIGIDPAAHTISAPSLKPIDSEEFSIAVEERVIALLETCRSYGIVAIHHRDSKFKSRIIAAVNQAETFTFTMARTHRHMLVSDGGEPGWLMKTLETKLQKKGYRFRALLADGFSTDSGFAKELATLKRVSVADKHRYDNRSTVLDLAARLGHMLPTCDFRVRLLNTAPSYSCLITDYALFYEPYLPSITGGQMPIFEYRASQAVRANKPEHPSVHSLLLSDFVSQYNQGRSPDTLINDFAVRRLRPGNDGGDIEASIYSQYLTAAEIYAKAAQEDLALTVPDGLE